MATNIHSSTPTDPMSAPEPVQHSTLEVDLSQDGRAAPIVGRSPDEEKEINFKDDGKLQVAGSDSELQPGSPAPPYTDKPQPALPTQDRNILGLRRKTFFIAFAIAAALIIAVAIGGGVGGGIAARNRKSSQNTVIAPPPRKPPYANTGLAAMQWTDLNDTLHKRVYYQGNDNKIRESAWDNSTALTTPWQINSISDAAKPVTPIAATSGWPHASYNYSLVKNVYYLSPGNEVIERQAPSNASQTWENDNFSGLYSADNTSYLTAYWNVNIQNKSEELVVLFQEADFADGITQARYTSNSTTSNPWVANNFQFSQPKGNAFAMALVSFRSGKHLMLYTVDDSKILQQHEYTISDTDLVSSATVQLTAQQSTGLTIDPHAPLAVVAQDNQLFYPTNAAPQCMFDTPLANLIIYTSPDRSSLSLNAWNCTSGFVDQTPAIQPLQKANTTFLSLAAMSDRATGDGNLYLLFDSGTGPLVEEWTVPQHAGDPWTGRRNVTVDFGL